jgi:hypothetical protein
MAMEMGEILGLGARNKRGQNEEFAVVGFHVVRNFYLVEVRWMQYEKFHLVSLGLGKDSMSLTTCGPDFDT